MNEPPDPTPEQNGQPGNLWTAFWLWFVAGSLAVYGLPPLIAKEVNDLGKIGEIAATVLLVTWPVALPLYLIFAFYKVWRSGQRAAKHYRWTTRLLLIVIYGLMLSIMFTPPIDFTVKAKVAEASHVAYAVRTAASVACQEGKLRTGMSHGDLNLGTPESYASNYAQEVRVSIMEDLTTIVTVTMKAIEHEGKTEVSAGDTLVYLGRCENGEIQWGWSGTVPEEYQPKS